MKIYHENPIKFHASIVIVKNFLLSLDTTIAQIVLLVLVMFLVITINMSTNYFTFERNPFIRESIIIKTKLKKW